MNGMIRYLGIFLFCSLSFPILASTQLEIQKLLAPYGKKAAFSLKTLDGKSLIEINSKDYFKPASTAKLISTACVFEGLGSDFQFETPWSYQGRIENGVLHGDIIVKGRGDFSFVIEDLKMIVEYLRFVHGIKEINGKLIFDTSYLSQPVIQAYEGFDGDRGRAFQSILTALPINHNAFSIWVVPDPKAARVEVLPYGGLDLKIENKLKQTKGRLGGSQTNLDFRPESLRLILSGKIGLDDPVKIYYRALPNPYESLARLFEANFQLVGGTWKRQWAFSNSTEKSKLLWVHRSRSISRLLIDVNKLSTNFGAEMALWAAAAKKLGEPVNLEKADQYLASCLRDFGFLGAEFQLQNASGLARSSKFQPEAMTRFLASIPRKPYFPEYLSTLSILGQDGTTRSRLKGFNGKARLKTGTLSDVRSLAGYIFPTAEVPRIMTLVLNCSNCDMQNWQRVEDKILELLITKP